MIWLCLFFGLFVGLLLQCFLWVLPWNTFKNVKQRTKEKGSFSRGSDAKRSNSGTEWFLTCFYEEVKNDLNVTFFFPPNLDLFQILPWIKKTKNWLSCFLAFSHTKFIPVSWSEWNLPLQVRLLPYPTRARWHSLYETREMHSGIQWKGVLLGAFWIFFLFPNVCFFAPLDTVQPRSRMFSHSYQFVFSEVRTWAHLTCGCDKWSHISLRDQWDSLLCWWVALCIVCIHTGGHEYLVINSGFESSASFILLVEFFLYFHLKYIVSWVSAVVHRHFEETFVLCIVVTWLLSTPCLVGSWWKDLLLFL